MKPQTISTLHKLTHNATRIEKRVRSIQKTSGNWQVNWTRSTATTFAIPLNKCILSSRRFFYLATGATTMSTMLHTITTADLVAMNSLVQVKYYRTPLLTVQIHSFTPTHLKRGSLWRQKISKASHLHGSWTLSVLNIGWPSKRRYIQRTCIVNIDLSGQIGLSFVGWGGVTGSRCHGRYVNTEWEGNPCYL